MTTIPIHPDFRWNGKKPDKNQLLNIAQASINSEEQYLQDIGFFFRDWLNTDDHMEVQTSGSTGTPKKMWVQKEYMVNSARATEEFFDLPAGTTALLCLPATYIAGKLMLVRALVLGWKLDCVKPQANPLSGNTTLYDFMAVTPYQLQHAFNQLSQVKKIMVGGGAVSYDLFKQIQKATSKIYETYAMTETLTHIAARRINGLENLNKPPFRLLKDVKVQQDQRGCLVIHAPKVSDKVIYTNDIVELINSKEFYLKGRIDNVINSAGIKIHPEEVEQKLSSMIKERFFVMGLPDPEFGEKVVLVVEKNSTEKEKEELHNQIKTLTNLSRYEQPKAIFGIEKFLETHSGKIKREATLKSIKH